MRSNTFLPVAVLVLGLSACTGTGMSQGESTGSVELAMSRQEAASPERQRAKVHTELGRLYLLEERFDIALDEARIALESDGSYAPAHSLVALVHMALSKNDSAQDSFRQALGLAPNDPEINNDYGWFLCQTGRAGESLKHFRIAINNRLFTSPGKALTNAGLCSLVIREDRQAEEYFVQSLRIDRGNVPALYWLADIAYRANRLADARQRIKELHALIEPTAASAWLALRIDRKFGDRDGEARYQGILRRKYRESSEFQKLTRGEFD